MLLWTENSSVIPNEKESAYHIFLSLKNVSGAWKNGENHFTLLD